MPRVAKRVRIGYRITPYGYSAALYDERKKGENGTKENLIQTDGL